MLCLSFFFTLSDEFLSMMMDDDAKQQTVPLFILNKVLLLLAINTEHILSFVAIFSSEKKS